MQKATSSQPIRHSLRPFQWLQPHWGKLVQRQELILIVLLLICTLALGLGTDTFLSSSNLLNIGVYASWFGIAALGAGLVIMVGGIDLSVASVMALAGLVCALALQVGVSLIAAIGLGLLCGACVGLLNGVLVSQFGLPPFIVTLGSMGLARGITLALTSGAPVRDLPPQFRALGQGEFNLAGIGLAFPICWMLLIACVVSFILHQTVLGRYIYTVGTDERALKIVGVPTGYVKLTTYCLSGILAAFGGILMTAKLGVAAPTAAIAYELDIIAAAVIGGASLFGGEGSVSGIILGTILMMIARNGLVLLGLPTYLQWLTIGAMILVVILLDFWRRRQV